MKRIFTLVLIVGITWTIRAQSPFSDQLAESQPIYRELIRRPDAKLQDIQRAFQLFVAKHPGKYKQYRRWEARAKLLVKPDGTLPSAQEISQAYWAFHQDNVQSRSVTSNWIENGPSTLPANNPSQPNGIGRINEIVFEPGNANTIYIGTPAAGLWKSTDGGSNWSSNTDALPSLGVSAIVVDKDDHNTIYIGTGDRDGFDSQGRGVMKSTDGGNNFVAINTGIPNNEYINDLIQDPNNANILIAGGYFNSFYRTTDGGANWTKVTNLTESITNLVFKPGNSQYVYATSRSGKFFRSTTNGQAWTEITSGFPNLGGNGSHRAFLAVSSQRPNDVYVVRANGRYFDGLYRSTDSGQSFTQQSSTPNILGYDDGTGDDEFSGQGFYDLTIVMDPTTAGTMYVGSVNIWKSTDYGATWTKKTTWYSDVHSDQHHLTFGPNGYCYAGNDGGIYYSTDGWDTETEITNGLSIAQLYKVGQSKQTQNLVLAGFQDNGTGRMDGSNWTTVVGGDGMECAIDPTDDSYKFMELYYGDVRRSVNNGWYESIVAGIEDGPWVTPYKINPSNSNMMVMGRDSKVWRSTNIKTGNPADVAWAGISSAFSGAGMDIAISKVDGKLAYYSTDKDELYRCTDITAANPSWTLLNLPLNGSSVNDILTHPTNLNTVYITLDQSIYKSTDKGANWTDITNNFPSLKPLCLAYDKNTNEGIYAGTPAGVYYLEPGTNNWTDFSTNLPVNVDARELEIYYDDANPSNNLIRVATYGRGMWTSPLAAAPLPVSLLSFAGKKINHAAIELTWRTSSEINNDFFIIERSDDGIHFESIGTVKGAGQSTTVQRYTHIDDSPKEGINYYRLIQVDNDGVKTFHQVISVSFSVDGFQGVDAYPNPAKDKLTVMINHQFSGLFDIELYRANGQLLLAQKQVKNGSYTLDISHFPKGVYYLEVKNESVLNTRKVIIE